MAALKHLPVIAVTGAIVQLAVETDRRPLRLVGSRNQFGGKLNLGLLWRESRQNGSNLIRVNAPHAGVAQLAAGPHRSALHGGQVTEFGDDAMRRHFAIGVASRGDFKLGTQHQRMTELTAAAHGISRNCAIVARDKIHQTKADGLNPRMCRQFKGVVHRPRRLDQHMQWQRERGTTDRRQGFFHLQQISRRLHFRNHQMTQAMTGLTDDAGDVGLKSGVVQRMHANRHAGLGSSSQQQGHHQGGVISLTAHRRAVFAVQRHVKNASAKLLTHLGLQLQAFTHARLDAAVVIAHRQRAGCSLGT